MQIQRVSKPVRSSSVGFFSRKFFQPRNIPLLLRIERIDFIAARLVLRGSKRSACATALPADPASRLQLRKLPAWTPASGVLLDRGSGCRKISPTVAAC
jgi:hypothetical protein